MLTNATIIELKELGLGENVVIEKIKASRCNFDVSINGLKQLKAAGTTVVINSHRTSVLPAADKMLVLKDGQVAAFGPRDEVLTAMQKASDEAKRPRIAAQPSLVGSAA